MRSATVLTEKRAGKMGLSEGVLSLNSQILAVLIDSINWHDLYVRAATLEFLFSVFLHKGCQESMIAVNEEREGVRSELLGLQEHTQHLARALACPASPFPLVSWKKLDFSAGLLQRQLLLACATDPSMAQAARSGASSYFSPSSTVYNKLFVLVSVVCTTNFPDSTPMSFAIEGNAIEIPVSSQLALST